MVGLFGATVGYLIIRNEDSLAVVAAEVKRVEVTPTKEANNTNKHDDTNGCPGATSGTLLSPPFLETILLNYGGQLIFVSCLCAHFALFMLPTDWFSLFLQEHNLQTIAQTTELLVWLEVSMSNYHTSCFLVDSIQCHICCVVHCRLVR